MESALPLPQRTDIGEKLDPLDVVPPMADALLAPPWWRVCWVLSWMFTCSYRHELHEAFEVLGGGGEEEFFVGS
ncbi:MAG: hypothetical protein ABJ327_02875 [Litoreibacter sp.]